MASDQTDMDAGGRRFRAAALLLATFAAGGIAGYALAGFRAPSAPVAGQSTVRVQLKEGLPAAFESLGLTADQRREITAILARARPRTDSTLREVIPRLRVLTDSVDAEIRVILQPEQREKLSKIRGAGEPLLVLKRAPGNGAPMRVDTLTPGRRAP
jgi:Spy/CpxP family protein refolding chaperone